MHGILIFAPIIETSNSLVCKLHFSNILEYALLCQSGVVTYNGIQSCIINNQSYENDSGTSRGDGGITDSLDEDDSSCSSSTNASGSFYSHWTMMKRDEQGQDERELSDTPQKVYAKEKAAHNVEIVDVETMKEKFSKLLLGDDVTGGRKGVSTALALSNAITNLAGKY